MPRARAPRSRVPDPPAADIAEREAKTPTRRRGKRTRANLLTAAQKVFEEDGFLNARVADIAAAAGVAHGSFYTYFDSKEDVFRELVGEVVEELHAGLDADDEGPAADRIRAALRRYVELYERYAPMLGLIEQVGTLAEFHDLRRALRARYVEAIERTILALRDAGEITVEPLDAHVTANALAGMMDSFSYAWFVLKEPFDHETAVGTLDAIWLRTLAVSSPATSAAPPPR